MNYRLVSAKLGFMLLLLTGAMGICLGIGYLLPPGSGHSNETALNGWEISLALTLLACGILFLLGRKASQDTMLRKDAAGIVALGWLVCSAFSALPYLFCEPKLSVGQALFESVSGLTTTGASVFDDLNTLPKTILLWRSLTQWLGGLGILAMFVLISSGLGAGGRSLFRGESSMHANEEIGARMRQTAVWLWMLYIALTLLCAVGLSTLGMTLFQAVNHAMASISTGGFGTENDSMTGFSSPIKVWIIGFMFLGGISFPLQLALIRKRDGQILRSHEETWTFAGILCVASLAILSTRALANNLTNPWPREAIDSVFNAVSIATSTGFAVGNYDSWPALSKGILLFLMVIGGCSGSTAGGLKVSRLVLWLKVLHGELTRVFRPNLILNYRMNGRPVPPGTQGQLFLVLTAAVATAALGSYFFVAFEPDRSVDGCVTAVVSCLSNTGPAFNEFGPTHNFAGLSPHSLLLLSTLMILGRLEYVAFLVLLSVQLWKRF